MWRLIVLFLIFALNCNSQTIYFEDFSDDWKKGAITYGGVTPAQPTDGNWSWVKVGSPDNDGGSASSWNDMAFIDGAAVMSSTGATSSTLAFRWNDVNNGSTANRVDWYSKEMLGNYTGVSLSVDYAIGNGSSANSIYVYYIIDGGTATLFGSSVNQSTASGTFTISSLSCGTSIQIYVKAITRDFNAAYVLIDNVTITGATALPIELLYFNGKNENTYNHLTWSTATELNNDYFTILRSVDGVYFHNIAIIPGAGNSINTLTYSFDDYTYEGTLNYYVLKQTDYDGRYKNSDIISVLSRERVAPTLIKITNLLGQDISDDYHGIVLFYYSDGTIVKKMF